MCMKKKVVKGVLAVCVALAAMVISDFMYQNQGGHHGFSAAAEYRIPE